MRIIQLPVVGLLLLSIASCNRPSTTGLTPVTGTVTLDQVRVAHAKILFIPVSAVGRGGVFRDVASASTDENGHYTLQTDGQPGAFPGLHYVLISKLDPKLDEHLEADAKIIQSTQPKAPTQPKLDRADEIFPPFFNYESTLTFVVPVEGPATANFDISIFDLPLKR